ncbi:MAG: hypothetical protein MJ209_02620 [archaeon]|nr:hypothetical protein [archaeon]
MSEEDFKKAYDFFSKDTEKNIRKMNSIIDAKLKAVDKELNDYPRKNGRDFSESFNSIFKVQMQTLNERAKLRGKFKYSPSKRDDIARMREKARKLRKY